MGQVSSSAKHSSKKHGKSSSKVEYSMYDTNNNVNKDEGRTRRPTLVGDNPVAVDNFKAPEMEVKKQNSREMLIQSDTPQLNWASENGILTSGCFSCSKDQDWKAALIGDNNNQKVALTIEPNWNITSCCLSCCVFYPICFLYDADAIELALERDGDIVFFTCRQKFLYSESLLLNLKGVSNISVNDHYSPEEGEDHGVNVEISIDYDQGNTTYQLPHSYEAAFFKHFMVFSEMGRDLIDGRLLCSSTSTSIQQHHSIAHISDRS